REVQECERGGRWFGCLWHLDRLASLKPGDADYESQRARLGSFLALTRLAAGDPQGYRRECDRLLKGIRATSSPDQIPQVAWIGVLGPNEKPTWETAVRLAEGLVARQPHNPEYLRTLGAGLYRSGRLQAARQRLEQAIAAQPEPIPAPRKVPGS